MKVEITSSWLINAKGYEILSEESRNSDFSGKIWEIYRSLRIRPTNTA